MNPPTPKHAWTFARHFRAHAYGWKGSRLAAKRLREAVTEIRAVARKDAALGMEGAVLLVERFVAAVCNVDDSWGVLGTALNREFERLQPVLSAPSVEARWRRALLRRLLDAWHADEYGYLAILPEVFPRFVSTPEEARDLIADFERRAEEHDRRAEQIQAVEFGWSYPATVERVARDAYRQMAAELELRFLNPQRALELALAHDFYDGGVTLARALLTQGRRDDAWAVLQAGLSDPRGLSRLQATWFTLLVEAGELEAAYETGVRRLADRVTLEQFRRICKGLPDVDRARLAHDALALTPEHEKGRWFATLNSLALFDVAAELARDHEVAPETALRAATRFRGTQPVLAFESYVAAARGIALWGEHQNDWYLAELVVRPALVFAESLGRRDDMLARLRSLDDLRAYPMAWDLLGGVGGS